MVLPLNAAGRYGLAKFTPRVYLADKLNNLGDEITPYFLAGNIEMILNRRIKMQFTGTLREPSIINPFSDYLAPFIRIDYSDGSYVDQQLGLFSIPPTGEESSYMSSVGSFEGYDISWNLTETTFNTTYTVTAGANVVDTVVSILAAEGFTRYSIPASAKTFPKTRTYKLTRDKWNIINAMLRSIGYYHAWVDLQGVVTSMPYINYDLAEPALELFGGKGSMIVGTIPKEPLRDQIYNKVRVIGERPKTNTPIIQTLTNSNPLSPVSTNPPPNGIGRVRMFTIEDSDINDSATALEVGRRFLQESASQYTRYEIQTLPLPQRGFFEVYDATVNRRDGTEVLAGRYRVSGWDLALDHRIPMRHYINRNEPYV